MNLKQKHWDSTNLCQSRSCVYQISYNVKQVIPDSHASRFNSSNSTHPHGIWHVDLIHWIWPTHTEYGHGQSLT